MRTPVIVALLCCAAAPAAAVPVLSVQPASTNVAVGDTFSVDVVVTDAADLFAYQFDVGFDPTRLTANSVTEGPLLGTGGATFFIPGAIDMAAGLVTATANTLLAAVPGVPGSGVLATINFTATASGLSAISLFNAMLLESSLSAIPGLVTQTGSVSATTGGAVPEPSTLLLMLAGLAAAGRLRRHLNARPS